MSSFVGVQILQRAQTEGSVDLNALTLQQQTLQRSHSNSNVSYSQQPQLKSVTSKPVTQQNQVKTIQNISMTTTDSRNVVFSTNTQMTFNKNPTGQGPFIGELAKRLFTSASVSVSVSVNAL